MAVLSQSRIPLRVQIALRLRQPGLLASMSRHLAVALLGFLFLFPFAWLVATSVPREPVMRGLYLPFPGGGRFDTPLPFYPRTSLTGCPPWATGTGRPARSWTGISGSTPRQW